MNYTFIIFIAMTGAAALGFLFAWALRHHKSGTLKSEKEDLARKLLDEKMVVEKLRSELEFQQELKNSLQKKLQDVENQALIVSQELQSLNVTFEVLSDKHRLLEQNQGENVREIDVIREVPVLVYREPKRPMDRRTKAKELVKAFRKGYSKSGSSTVPPAT